jgi:hypothetical protein
MLIEAPTNLNAGVWIHDTLHAGTMLLENVGVAGINPPGSIGDRNDGFRLANVSKVTLRDCYSEGPIANARSGFILAGGCGAVFLDRCEAVGHDYGFYFSGCDDVLLRDCLARHNDVAGFNIAPADGDVRVLRLFNCLAAYGGGFPPNHRYGYFAERPVTDRDYCHVLLNQCRSFGHSQGEFAVPGPSVACLDCVDF